MHFCLERLEKIILDDKERTRRCRRIRGDTALEITDLLFGAKVLIAEWVPPFSIQIAIRLTPSMKKADDRALREIYEHLMDLTTKDALQLIFDPDEKKCAVGIKFPCEQSYTNMEGNLGDCADELYSFVDRHMDNINGCLNSQGICVE